MRSEGVLAAAFAVALGSGFAATYGVVRLGSWVMLEGNADAGVFVSWLAPMGGLAAFALVYGLGRGRALRLWFWLVGPVVVYAAAVLGAWAAGQGASLVVAVILAAVVAGGAALMLPIRDLRHG